MPVITLHGTPTYQGEVLPGTVIANWTVIRLDDSGRYSRRYWICRCKCGLEKPVRDTRLRLGQSKSCLLCSNPGSATKHGGASGADGTPTYRAWTRMRKRCNNPNTNHWKYYGARGITVCERLDDFAAFLEDMGELPEGHSLDRIDPNGNYTPSNCRWATAKTQMRNRTVTKLKADDVAEIRRQLAKRRRVILIARDFGVSGSTVYGIKNGRIWA